MGSCKAGAFVTRKLISPRGQRFNRETEECLNFQLIRRRKLQFHEDVLKTYPSERREITLAISFRRRRVLTSLSISIERRRANIGPENHGIFTRNALYIFQFHPKREANVTLRDILPW